MYKYLIIYNILVATFIQGNVIPAIKSSVKAPVDNGLSQDDKNKTSQAMSEGGAISSSPITLSNDNESLPKILDKDLSINKAKSVVPRKGVVYNPAEDAVSLEKTNQSLINVKNNNVTNTPVPLEMSKQTNAMLNESNTITGTQKSNITRIHKPLILSHEALAKMDEINHLNLDESAPEIKIHSIKAGGNPAMIMPIVITILVVPMFAVVGYMAIKRGQEAWKNRHYKRMDFLLDGMYND